MSGGIVALDQDLSRLGREVSVRIHETDSSEFLSMKPFFLPLFFAFTLSCRIKLSCADEA